MQDEQQETLGDKHLGSTDESMEGSERDKLEEKYIMQFFEFADEMGLEVDILEAPNENESDNGDLVVLKTCDLEDKDNHVVYRFEKGDVIDVKGHWVNPTQHETKHYFEWVVFMDRYDHNQIGIVEGLECEREGKKGVLRFNSNQHKYYLVNERYVDIMPEDK